MNEAETFLRDLRSWQQIVEGAGLFWLGAEFLILWVVLLGRRFLAEGQMSAARSVTNEAELATPRVVSALQFPRSNGPRWNAYQSVLACFGPARPNTSSVQLGGRETLEVCIPTEDRGNEGFRSVVASAATWLVIFLLLAIGTFPRLLIPVEADVLTVRDVILQHFAVWTCFVAGWVLLEVLIVYHGWRAYNTISRAFRGMHDAIPSNFATTVIVFAFVVLTLVVTYFGGSSPSPDFGSTVGSVQEVPAALQHYQNGVYLALRVAGVVWIAVEWVAAVYLVRGFFLLRQHVPADRVFAHG